MADSIEGTNKKGSGRRLPSPRFRALRARTARQNRSNTWSLEKIREWASMGMIMEEIAARLNVDVSYLNDCKARDADLEEALLNGDVDLKESLRRLQVKLAMQGSVPMAIWLGKQYLGQRDKHEVENNTKIDITVQRAMEELRALPKDALLEANRMLTAPVIDNQAEALPEQG